MKKFKRILFKIKKRGITYYIMPKSVIMFNAWAQSVDDHALSLYLLSVGKPAVEKILDSERASRHMDRVYNLYLKHSKK